LDELPFSYLLWREEIRRGLIGGIGKAVGEMLEGGGDEKPKEKI
jgi:hypothetical protein